MPHGRLRLVADVVTGIDQAPDEVDVFSVAERFVEPVDRDQRGPPDDQRRGRDITDATQRQHPTGIGTHVQAGAICFVLSEGALAWNAAYSRCDGGDLGVLEVR